MPRTARHLAQHCHYAREQHQLANTSIRLIPGTDNIADVFTKRMYGPLFKRMVARLGLLSAAALRATDSRAESDAPHG